MTWIRRCKQKKLISKISVHSNFTFSSYACVFRCSHRPLCWMKSCIWDFLWKLLSFHTENYDFSLFLLGSALLRGELQKYAKYSNFENFETALYLTSGSMPLSQTCSVDNKLASVISDVWFGTSHSTSMSLIKKKLFYCSVFQMFALKGHWTIFQNFLFG